jgi:pimeloyl-ACP methyl ester carboxylesterase/DNA-binding CsgD family transcriptional regulator
VPTSQHIRFCKSADGTRIAYALNGAGDPLVRAAHWVGHLDHEMNNPVIEPWISLLSRRHRLLRYDSRGCGLSDRDNVELTFQRQVEDLRAVVDAAGLDRFVLFGMAGGASIAVAFAAQYPERVTHLVLHGACARAKIARGEVEDGMTQVKAVEIGWGNANPAFRQLFTSQLLPDATADEFAAFNALIQQTTAPASAARILHMFFQVNLTEVAPRIRCPTLIFHSREDGRIPFEQGRELACLISGAEFHPLQSRNHLILRREPAWAELAGHLDAFLPRRAGPDPRIESLTARERQLLSLVAKGMDNRAIASLSAISEKTVRNHVSNIFSKIGATSRAQAVALARDAGLNEPDRGRTHD